MDYGERGQDTRIARFLSMDPLTRNFAWYTPYQFAGNSPIQAIDIDGAEEYHYTRIKDNTGQTTELKVNGQKDIVDRVQTGWRTSTSGGNDGLIPVYKNVVNQRQTYVVDEIRTGFMDINGGQGGAREVKYPVSTTYSSFDNAFKDKDGAKDWGTLIFYAQVGAQNMFNEYKQNGGGGSSERVPNARAKTGKPLEFPGRVQSRINLKNDGWKHVLQRHFSDKNASQFTVSPSELRSILQSPEVVKTPVTRIVESAQGPRYLREVTLDRPIGLDKYGNFQPTSTMTVLSDKYGNLITATPGTIK